MDSLYTVKESQVEIILFLKSIFGLDRVMNCNRLGHEISVSVDCDNGRTLNKAEDICFSLPPECCIKNTKISYLTGVGSSKEIDVTMEILYDEDDLPISLIIDGKKIISKNCIPRYSEIQNKILHSIF